LSYASKPLNSLSFHTKPLLFQTQNNTYTGSCELRTLIFIPVFVK